MTIRLAACARGGLPAWYAMVATDRTRARQARERQWEAGARAQLLAERARIAADLDEQVRSGLLGLLEKTRGVTDPETARRLARDAVDVVDGVIARTRGAVAELLTPVPTRVASLISVPLGTAPDSWTASDATEATGRAARSTRPRTQAPSHADASTPWTFEQALAVMDELPGITVWDLDQVNCFGNRNAVQGIGRGHRADMIGRTRLELFGPDVAARSGPYAEAAARCQAQRYDSDFVDGAGVRRRVHFVYDPVLRDGRAVGLVATLNDIDPAEPDGPDDRLAVLTADRERIAEDLHDHVIQHLYAAGLAFDAVRSDGDIRGLAQNAAPCVVAATTAIERSVHDLHAVSPGGLDDSVAEALRRATPTLGVYPHLDTIGDITSVGSDLGDEVLAVLTESLSNVARHADADDVRVTLSVSGRMLRLSVADNGRGLGAPTRSSGLANLANRAARRGGTFTHRPNEPHGTVIDWSAPL